MFNVVGSEELKGKKQNTRVCEAAFLILLGYIKSTNASSANHMWQGYKKLFFENRTLSDIRGGNRQKKGEGRKKSRKFINAEVFLRLMMQIYGDTMPTTEGTSSDGDKERKILPYESLKSLYQEYRWQCSIEKTHPDDIAKKTLFVKVYKSMKDEIRLLGCKGIFIYYNKNYP